MQQQEKEWWKSEIPQHRYPAQSWSLRDEIGWYNISILKKSFKDEEKCLTTSFFYIDICLEEPFQKIEDIISNTENPLVIREKIAKRFGLQLTETYGDKKIVRNYTSTPSTSTPSTPIMENFVVLSDEELPEVKFTTTRKTPT